MPPVGLIVKLPRVGRPPNDVFCNNDPWKSKKNSVVIEALIADTASSSSVVIAAPSCAGSNSASVVPVFGRGISSTAYPSPLAYALPILVTAIFVIDPPTTSYVISPAPSPPPAVDVIARVNPVPSV